MKLNNDNLSAKIAFRKSRVKPTDNILDCFAGENKIWSQIPHNEYLGIDKNYKGTLGNMKGDSYRIIPHLDISRYDVIDIDCYGIPFKMLSLIINNPTLPSKVRFFLTYIKYKATPCLLFPPVIQDAVKYNLTTDETESDLISCFLRGLTESYEMYQIYKGIEVKKYITFEYNRRK